MEPTKVCAGPCGLAKPLSAFNRCKRNKDGYKYSCRECLQEREYELHPERRPAPKIEEPEGFRWCTGCEELHILDSFHIDRGTPRRVCKDYVNGQSRERYASDEDYRKNVQAGNKKWLDENREQKRARDREYGLVYRSKEENKERKRVWTKNNPRTPEQCRNQSLKNHYGITTLQFEEMIVLQEGWCAICQEQPAEHVDHDHGCCPGYKTCGECIREVTCKDCNTLLGKARDSIPILTAMISYLESNLNWVIDKNRNIPRVKSDYYFPDIPWDPEINKNFTSSKVCPICREEKDLSEFGVLNSPTGPKPESYCKVCDTLRRKVSTLARSYGMSLEEFNSFYADQGYVCKICCLPPAEGYFINVDHDPVLMVVRGLLCVNCNWGLGNAKDSVEILKKAIQYLERHGVKR